MMHAGELIDVCLHPYECVSGRQVSEQSCQMREHQKSEIDVVPDPTCNPNQIETFNDPFGKFPARYSGDSCIWISGSGISKRSTFDFSSSNIRKCRHAPPPPLRPRRPSTPTRPRLTPSDQAYRLPVCPEDIGSTAVGIR